jgi:hypothetical protein
MVPILTELNFIKFRFSGVRVMKSDTRVTECNLYMSRNALQVSCG